MKTSNLIRIAVCVAILFTLLAHPSPVRACSCVADVTIPDNFAQHDAVFAGKVVRIVDNYAPIFSTLDNIMHDFGYFPYFFNEGGRYWGYSIFFKVINSWKGIEKTIVEVDTGNGMGDCGYSFTMDQEYLIYASYAYGIPDNYWVTGTCSRTAELSNAADDLKYLNTLPILPLKFSIPILLTEKDAIIYGLPLMIVGIVFFIRRRRKAR